MTCLMIGAEDGRVGVPRVHAGAASISRAPGGSSTTPMEIPRAACRRSAARRTIRAARCTPVPDQNHESSTRRSSSGSELLETQYIAPSSGRTAARRAACQELAAAHRRNGSRRRHFLVVDAVLLGEQDRVAAARRGSASIVMRQPGDSPLERSTVARVAVDGRRRPRRPIRPTPRARCCTTSTRTRGRRRLCDLFGIADGDAAGGTPLERRLRNGARRKSSAQGIPILGIAGGQWAALSGRDCWTRGPGKNRAYEVPATYC